MLMTGLGASRQGAQEVEAACARLGRRVLLDLAAAKVDETDALFTIGACAAFVSYLINRSRAAGLLR
jgi:threonine/homoserine efflux transporter RhtA